MLICHANYTPLLSAVMELAKQISSSKKTAYQCAEWLWAGAARGQVLNPLNVINNKINLATN